jgi:hypothetical protein
MYANEKWMEKPLPHLVVEEVFNPHTPGFLGHSRAQLRIQVQDTRGLSYPRTYTK